MTLLFTPSWPAAWTEAAVQLLVAVLALVLIRVSGNFPFDGLRGADRIRRQAVAGALLGVPSLLVAAWLAPAGEPWGLGLSSLFPVVVLAPLALILAVGGFVGGRKSSAPSPAPTWSTSLLGWSCYLLGYEALFRGTLLWALLRAAGAWPAIVVSTAVYALAHLDRRPGEVLGSVPLGVIWGMAALEAGGIWPALLCHVALAVAFDLGQARVAPVN